MTRQLVERFGQGKVWSVGLDALGYPPTWITHGSEVAQLRSALEDGDVRG